MSDTRVDLSELEAGVKQLIGFTSKTGPEVLNQRTMNVSGRAANNTKAASPQQIHSELGVIARGLKSKGGKLSRGKKIYATGEKGAPLAALIVNARRGKAGKKGLYGKEMEAATRRMIGGRTRSKGFEKSGWFPGIKTMAKTLKKPFIIANMQGISVKGQPKGSAIPASPNTLTPLAFIENTAKGIVEVGSEPLRAAVQQESAEITRHIANAMQPGIDRFNRT